MSWAPLIGASTSTTVYFYNKFAEKGKFGLNAPYFTPAIVPSILSGGIAMGVFAKTRWMVPTICFTTSSLCALAILGIHNSVKSIKTQNN